MDGKNLSNYSTVPASSSGPNWPKLNNLTTRATHGKSQPTLTAPSRFPPPGNVRLGRGNTDYSPPPPPLQSHPVSTGYPINQPPGIIGPGLISNNSNVMNMHPHPGAGNSSIPSSYPNQMPRGQQHQQPPMASMNIGHDHSGPPPNSFIPPTIAYPVPSRAQYPPQPPPGMINSNPNMMPNQNQSILGNLNAPQQQQQQQQGSEGNKMRVFTGTVKKMHGNFGFVDDDVYFQLNTVKGPPPKLGDRVLVEAAYNANMPFKWNASRVQVLPHVSSNDVSGPMQQQLQRQLQPNQGVKVRDGDRDRNRGRRDRDRARAKPDADNDPSRANGNSTPSGRLRGQSCDRHPRPTSAPRNAGKGDESARRRSRSPRRPTSAGDSTESTNMRHRSRSPRRNHHGHHSSLDEPISPPYRVAIPKISTAAEEAGVMTLKSRYPNLYIPSDFFSAQFSWSTAFDTQSQFPLMRKKAPLKVHVFPKDVETLDADGEGPRGAVNADDCSHEYSAKVMLPSWPSFREVCDQTLGSLGSSKPSPAPTAEPRHPTRCLEFLVGTKNRNEIGAIGGPWSPSLDGKNPAENPHVLINTAVRTFKSLTGIDLDGCNTWYKFVELHYFRSAEDYKGKITPAHVETVVIFIPDIWRLQLDVAKWKKSAAAYEVIGQRKLQELADAAPASAAESEAEAAVAEVATADVTGNQMMHWSELDPKNMKIDDLRMQLKLRKLSDAGLKSNLIARMHKAIKADQEADDLAGEMEDREASTAAPSESKPKGKSNRVTRYEREKVNLEKLFFLQEDTPKLVVHPCKTAKGGKFDCAVMSLSVLLDYRQEDQKESSFEVSLFAELFNEMLLRDFGLKIYRTMSTMAKINPVADKTKASGEDVKGKAEGTPSAAVIEAAPVIYTPAIPPFDPFLLVAFVYFDLNRTGYILEKDLGELLETLGLSLSRNQIKSVVSGFAGQDGQKVYYENLCEKYDGSIIMEGQEFMEEDEEEEEDDSLGNMQLVRCLKEKSVEGSVGSSLQNGNKGKKKKDSTTDSSETSMVFFRGSMIDLDKLHQQLAVSESSTRHIKEKLVETEAEIERVKSRKMQLEKNALKDGTEIETLQATLNTATDNLRMQRGKLTAFSNVLQCQRDALAKGVEIIRKTLDKYAPEQDDSSVDV